MRGGCGGRGVVRYLCVFSLGGRQRRPQDRTRPVPRGRAPRGRLGSLDEPGATWDAAVARVCPTNRLSRASGGRGRVPAPMHAHTASQRRSLKRGAEGARRGKPPAATLIMLRGLGAGLLAVAASGFVAPAAPKQATALAASGSQIAYRIRRKRIANQVRDSAHHSLPAKLRLTCFSPAGQGPVAPERVPVEQPHLRPGHRR